MNKSSFKIYCLLIITLFLYTSCKKDKCRAGSVGNLSLKVYTMHHLKYIKGCTVKIKFDIQDFPGANGEYDLTTTAAGTDSFVTFNSLNCGDYYIYGTGIDSSLTPISTVKGGIPYSTTQENGTIELELPITE